MRRFIALAMAVLGVSVGLFAFSAPAVFAKPACLCKCAPDYDPIPRWSNLTAGNPDCRNDCAQACDGAENLESASSTGKLYQNVACVPGIDSDCKTGSFSVYSGVTCALEYGPQSQRQQDLNNFPDTGGKKPTCVIPITIQNANIECSKFGGIGAGATCDQIQGGTDPNTFDKSRSNLGGQPAANKYSGSYNYSQWESLFPPVSYDTLPASAGICQRYGILHGAGQTYDQGSAGDVDKTLTQDGTPAYDLVCLNRKQNQCGHVNRPSQPNATVPLNANAYSCQNQKDVAARGQPVGTYCWGDHNSLCGGSTDPDVLCCLGGTAGTGQCYSNADCGAGKMCNDSGNCVVNVVCDPQNTDRRCRSADNREKNNPDICTLPVLSSSPANCPTSGQVCCKAANPAALSSCASDLMVVANAAGDTRFNNFACLPASEVSSQLDPQTGTVKTFSPSAGLSVSGDSSWKDYDPNGSGPHCLGGTIVKTDPQGHVVGTVPRCGGTTYCCDAKALASPSQASEQAARKPVGSPCGTTDNQAKGFKCQDTSAVLPSENDAISKFGESRDDYLAGLASSGNCQITPYDSAILYSSKECVSDSLCCSPKVAGAKNCTSDADCGGGTRCELSIHACLDANVVNAAQSGASCATAASSENDGAAATFQAIIRANPDSGGGMASVADFTCQLIDKDTQGASDKCVPAGCSGSPVPAGEAPGTTSQCCLPGVGRSAGASSQKNTPPPPSSAFSIPLICDNLKTGDCTLANIVATGAGFANFLISISGAVFLAIFVYGGFLYLTAGTSDRAEKGKKMIIQATKAMVLLMAAFVIISFVQTSLISGGRSSSSSACRAKSTDKVTYDCKFLAAPSGDTKAISEERAKLGCQTGLCPGPDNYLCCPQ